MKKIFALLLTALLATALLVSVGATGDKTVVYLKDNGTGDGSSPDEAVATLTAAYNALDLSKDCTVVICGVYNQTGNFNYGTDYTGSVTITSVYGGTDYRTSGAVYKSVAARFVCFGETKLENLNFEALGTNLLMIGQHYPVTIGEGVSMTGEKMTGGTIAKSFCILGGYQNQQGTPPTEGTADTNITVLSGKSLYIVPFSREILGSFTGTAHIKIGGDAEVSVLHGSMVGKDGMVAGDVEIEISGNAHIKNFYGCTSDTTVNSYTFTWKSGTIDLFEWVCHTASTKVLTKTNGAALYVSEAVQASEGYAAIAANFDTVEVLPVTEDSTAAYGYARALYTLGLAQGYDTTGTNFGVFDNMTRLHTIVQVVRFLGVEEQVKAGTYEIPFTDVPAWAVNYVGYAYENGITKGISDTLFNPDGVSDEMTFLTYMLRAIGYSDADGDFVWNNPFALAKSVGMTENDAAGTSFNRGDAFTISWKTLSAAAKDGTTVSDKLMAAGVFTADAMAAAKQEILAK